MAKQMVEVDVPEGFVAVGHRLPVKGDWYYDSNGKLCEAAAGWNSCNGPRLVFAPDWRWPEWLLDPWVAMDPTGSWWTYTDEPVLYGSDDTEWHGEAHLNLSHAKNQKSFRYEVPPHMADWRTSKRKNPNT